MSATEEVIIGQDNLIKYFNKLAFLSDHQSLGGSFILQGPRGSGKKTLANFLIGKLLCQDKSNLRPCGQCPACLQLKNKVNGDVFWLSLDDDKKNISIDEVRILIRSLSLSSLTQGYKVAVIDRAEKLSHQASNALLKTLEEPNKKTIIVLLTTSLADLPKTIISRSQTFSLRPLAPNLVYDFLVSRGYKRSQAKNLSALSLGWPGLAIKLSEDEALADHLLVVEAFLKSLNADQLQRRVILDELLSRDFEAEEVLSIWQTVSRDLLLFKLARSEWQRYVGFLNQFQDKLNFSIKQALTWQKSIVQGKDYLAANVNQKLVLENIIFNL